MNLWSSLEGMIEVELTSAQPELSLETINGASIEVSHVRQKDALTFLFSIRRRDYPRLKRLCEKRGETLKVCGCYGLYWAMAALKKRPTLLLGMTLLLCLILYLPSRVFFVRVEGNTTVPDRKIIAAAEDCGIRFGASRRLVRSEKVKNRLLSAVPELQWAGVNTSGCVATISVRERSTPDQTARPYEVTSIVAARDGYLLSGTVTSGTALFTVGQTVREGQTLISGYSDAGICIRATRAEGEIFAQTSRELTVITPLQYQQRIEERGSTKKISLVVGKKRINLWKDSGNLDMGCGRIKSRYTLTLPGGFALPVSLEIETLSDFEMTTAELSQSQAEDALRSFADSYLSQDMIAGEILHRTEVLFREDGIYSLEGEYGCREMISRVHREQIGEAHGEDS